MGPKHETFAWLIEREVHFIRVWEHYYYLHEEHQIKTYKWIEREREVGPIGITINRNPKMDFCLHMAPIEKVFFEGDVWLEDKCGQFKEVFSFFLLFIFYFLFFKGNVGLKKKNFICQKPLGPAAFQSLFTLIRRKFDSFFHKKWRCMEIELTSRW